MPALHLPQDHGLIASYPQLAHRLEAHGYSGLWVGEVNGLDAVSSASLAAVGSTSAEIGVLLNVFTRAPSTLAMTASTLAALAPGRMNIVLGVASPLLVERWNGITYRQPFARLHDYLMFVRQALEGARVKGNFETFTTSGFAVTPPAVPPRLLLAVCGPLGLRLAAEEADGVVLNWMSASDLDRVEPLPRHRSQVSVVVPVCATPDRTVMESVMRPIVGDYLNAPAYAEQQRRLGRGEALLQMWERWDAGDRAGAHAALPSDVLDQLVVTGTPAECVTKLGDFERATGARAIATFFPPPGVSFEDCALTAFR